MNRAAIVFVVAALTTGSSGCGFSSPPADHAGDTAYARRLATYLRDSTVLDSLSRTVNTDSLWRLYRRALGPSGAPIELVNAVWCEELRLTLVHGVVPADRAIGRLRDTVYDDRGIHGRDAAFQYFADRAPASGVVDARACGPGTPRSARVIAGIPVDQEPRRPD